jgi:hypothetical protein
VNTMTQSIDELVESDKYVEFIDSYAIDDTEAAIHRARRSPRMTKLERILGAGIMIALVASFIYFLFGGQYSEYIFIGVFVAGFALISSTLLLDEASEYQARKSEVTDRELICYEVEAAIEEYQGENYEAVYQHLSDIDSVFVRGDGDSVFIRGREQGLSNRMWRWLQAYLRRVEDAEDRKNAIEDTFDRLAVHFIDDLIDTHEVEIYNIIEKIDTKDEKKEESSNRRALIDARKSAVLVMTSRFGVIGFSLLVAVFVYFVFKRETIAVAIPGIILAIYQIW